MEKHNNNDNNTSKQVLLSVLGVAILIVAVVGISFAAFTYSKAGATENTITTGSVTMSYDEGANGIRIENAVPMTDAQGVAIAAETNNVFDFTVKATIAGKTAIDYEVVAVKANVDDATKTAALDAAKTAGTVSATDTRGIFVPDENIRLYLEKSDTGATGSYTAAWTADGTGKYGKAWSAIDEANATGTTAVGSPNSSMLLVSGTFDATTAGTITRTDYYRLRMWVDSAYEMDGFQRSYTVKVNVYGKGRD